MEEQIDEALAQRELETARWAKSYEVVCWCANHGMPADLMTHLMFELGLVEREAPRGDFEPF